MRTRSGSRNEKVLRVDGAAVDAIAGLVGDDLAADRIVPDPFDARLAPSVAGAVSRAARTEGVTRDRVPAPHVDLRRTAV